MKIFRSTWNNLPLLNECISQVLLEADYRYTYSNGIFLLQGKDISRLLSANWTIIYFQNCCENNFLLDFFSWMSPRHVSQKMVCFISPRNCYMHCFVPGWYCLPNSGQIQTKIIFALYNWTDYVNCPVNAEILQVQWTSKCTTIAVL